MHMLWSRKFLCLSYSIPSFYSFLKSPLSNRILQLRLILVGCTPLGQEWKETHWNIFIYVLLKWWHHNQKGTLLFQRLNQLDCPFLSKPDTKIHLFLPCNQLKYSCTYLIAVQYLFMGFEVRTQPTMTLERRLTRGRRTKGGYQFLSSLVDLCTISLN